jgi:DNA polymerase-1
MKLFLLDAYALIYRSYYAFIKFPRINSKGLNTSAIFGFVNTLEELLKKENPTHIAVAFDPAGPTFRHEAFENYKAQREETPEVIRASVPIIKNIIRAYNIPILEVPGYEADDVIGTIARQAAAEGFDVFMMTPDKDYGQLVAPHIYIYKPKHGSNEIETLDEKAVITKYALTNTSQIIDLLGLMGDASDNIPGCPGIGEKTAQKLLEEFHSIDNLLENTGQLKGSLKTKIEENKQQILFSRFLATIKTDVPIAFHPDDCKRKNPDAEKIHELFSELEFKNLLTRTATKTEEKKAPDNIPVQGNLFAEFATGNRPIQGNLFAEFATEGTAESKYSNLRDLKSTDHQYYLIEKETDIQELIHKIQVQKWVAFDTETTGIDPVTAELVGLSFALEKNKAYYIPVPADFQTTRTIVNKFKKIFDDENILIIGQNIKYDIIVIHQYGIKVKTKLFDTMIAHYLLNPELRHNMDYLAETCLDYKTIHIDELIGAKGRNQRSMRNVPLEKIKEYACEDADITLQLKEILEKELEKQSMHDLFYNIEMPLIKVLAEMEISGIKVDAEAMKQLSEEMSKKLITIEQEIYRIAGIEFNINSPKQVGEILFDRMKIIEKPKKTKKGHYLTGEEVLESLKSKHPVVEKLFEYRGLKKLLGTYIDALPSLINPKTGKIHTSFNQTVTVTGRLSSSNPNLQNIPIRDAQGKEIRRAFVADNKDCLFFSADYSQIELRIMAHLSEDRNMLDAFNNSCDIHAATAAKIYKVPIEQVDKEMRRKAKTANFGIIYGISVFGLSERLNIPRSEAKELIEGYFATYPRVKEYMDESIRKAQKDGYVETLFHRKRYLVDINSRNSVVRGYAERNAINAPIQGSAADIIKVAMIRIFQRFEEEKLSSKMILQVHDELNFNVRKDELEMVKKIVIDEMEHAVTLKIPIIADCGVGENWLDAH